MNKDIDIAIEEIEKIFVDSNLSLYEAIGVLEMVKQLLFKALELSIMDNNLDKEKDGWWEKYK